MKQLKDKLFRKLIVFTLAFIMVMLFVWDPSRHSSVPLKPCKLATLDPWDESLKPYLAPAEPLKCSNKYQFIYINETGFAHFNNSILDIYKLDAKQMECFYHPLIRNTRDQRADFQSRIKFQPPFFIKSHMFRVNCRNKSNHLLYDYMHFNPFWNDDAKDIKDIENESPDKLSIVIFGIDSVSRSHALRNLNRSYKYLLEEFQTYDFTGYSKVGENTWPNLVPLLTGQSHRNFPLIGHVYFYADSLPLIWNEQEVKEKFISFYAEDRPDISTFNYMKSGFKNVPTDYYFRPYTLGFHEFEPRMIEPLGKPTWDCYGNGNYFDIQIEYLKGFLTRYRGKRKLIYFWNNQVSHETFNTLGRADEPFLKFLKWMKSTNQVANAILLVLSDHGFRIGGASLTHVGRAENNKPLLLLHVPKSLLQKYTWIANSLATNTQRLVSHYDIYQTLLDVVRDEAFIQKPLLDVQKVLVRRNIFEPIPESRTCVDAGIEEQYCTCYEKTNISATSNLIQMIAIKLVERINNILSNETGKCSVLQLHNVTEASVSYSNQDAYNIPQGAPGAFSFMRWFEGKKVDPTGRYNILFYTLPGYAYFEGTVDFAAYAEGDFRNKITVIGDPSRLNRYGNQSVCVTDSHIKLFCYCTS